MFFFPAGSMASIVYVAAKVGKESRSSKDKVHLSKECSKLLDDM